MRLQLGRALRWRCPTCGVSPIFRPIREVRGIRDWFEPLAGCERCGYAYEREPGYFLLAIWGLNYFVVASFGFALYQALEALFDLSLGRLITCTVIPVGLLSVLLIRHSKAVFLAIDRTVDPG